STIFGSGADKNAANPGTWTLGISSVPQKNDIIDVGGHIRRTDDGTGNDALMGYAYATTRNTSGTSYLDFEIFRTFPKLIGGQLTYNNGLPGAGPDGGHTASNLDCNPANFRPGDLIVSIDYTNGGSNACVSVYVWINPNNVDGAGHNLAWYNTQACRRFNFTGVFHTGTGAGPFGYAEITPLNGSASACLVRAVANTAAGVQAGPWGNLSAQNAAFQTTYEPLQLIEVTINFSALGLDIAPTLGPCVNLFGSLAVKTRSSASFTSELKDWTGPYLFGAFAELNADAGMDKNLSCTYPTATLCASSSNPNATFVWKTIPSLTQIATTQCVTVNQPGCYIVIATDNNLQTCSDTDTVCVTSVIDSIPPDVTCPPNLTISCNNLIPDGATSYQEFINQGGSIFDISGNLSVSFSDSPLNIGNCGATLTREYTVTDTCDNVGGCTQLITVNDTVNPIVTGPANVTLGCNPVIPAPNTALITATDNCTTPIVSVLPDAVSGDCQRTTTRTYRATDACGNFTDFVQTFTYKFDITKPVITTNCPGGNIGCNPTGPQINAALGTASVTDNCDNGLTATFQDVTTNTGCIYTTTRTWNVTDLCGNAATPVSCSVSYKIDTTKPVITTNCPGGNLGCNPTNAQILAALGSASVTDNCDNNLTASFTDQTSNNGCIYTTTRTWTVTDDCGNVATPVTCSVSYKVDTTAPVITKNCPGGNLGCNPTNAQINTALGTASVTDNCDNGLTATFQDATTNVGCIFTTTRTWNVSDLCGNDATPVSCSVSYKIDTTKPVITTNCPGGNLGCNPTNAQILAALGSASVTDNCDNNLTASFTDQTNNNGCIYTTIRTWTVTDGCGNVATPVTCSVTYKIDTSIPVITLNGPQGANPNLGCNPTPAEIEDALGSASVTDNCDNLTATSTTSNVTSNGCFRSKTRTFNAVDQCGNVAVAKVRTVTWKEDTQAPVVTCHTSNVITVCEGSPVAFTPSASDNCDGTLPVNCTRSDGQPLTAAYPVGTTTVTCSATDDCGNTGTCTLTIRVIDNPVCTINYTDPNDRPFCGSCNNSLTTNISGLDGTTTYSWSVDNTTWSIDNPSSANITYCAGSDTANFTLTVTNTVNGVSCTSTCTVQIICKPTHTCTYTQGAYGNAGGLHCSSLTTTAILLQQLATPLIIGDCSVGRCLTLTSADVTSGCIYRRLPGGGPSATITDLGTCDIPSGIATKGNGSFRNVLVAQTITLGLNLRVPGTGLGAMTITGPYMVTLASSGSLCADPSATPVPGTEIVRMIPTSVIAYLGTNNTVQDLFEAANQALAGNLPAGAPSLSTWNSAVSAFNEGFDECRILAGFYPTNPLDTTSSTTNNRLFDTTEPVAVQVYPNPSSDLANIEFILNGFDSEVQVEIFDLNGTRIDVLYNEVANADVRYRVEFNAGKLPSGVYMYQLTTDKAVITNKITVVK
ncbi:MAG: T9SS type A sorting domain-containing protein, partial [Bacteroidota bacterium]